MPEVFNLPVKVGASGDDSLNVTTVQFGDGYKSKMPNGINGQTSEWSVSMTGDTEKIKGFTDFIKRHNGAKSFYWKPPLEEQRLFTVEKWKTDTLGAGLFTVSATFESAFSAGDIEDRTVNIVEGGAIIDDKKPSTGTVYSGAHTDKQIKTAVDNLKTDQDFIGKFASADEFNQVKTSAEEAAKSAKAAEETAKKVSSAADSSNTAAKNSEQAAQSSQTAVNTASNYAFSANDAALDAAKSAEEANQTAQEASNNLNEVTEQLKNLKLVLSVNENEPDEHGNVTLAIDTGSEINDNVTAKDSTWSSKQISDEMGEAVKPYQGLPKKVSSLEALNNESRFTIIYPNGGTADKPANITNNNRYVMDNPFPKHLVNCRAEVFLNNGWGAACWQFLDSQASARGSLANQLMTDDWATDKIVLQVGKVGVAGYSDNSGTPHALTANYTTAPARVLVWRID